MKTYAIQARLIDRRAGTAETQTLEAKTVYCPAAGGWYSFEIDYAGDVLLSDHSAMRKKELLADAANSVLDFYL